MDNGTLKGVYINKNKTTKRVRKFLSDDFVTYMNRGALHATDLSSVQLDVTGAKIKNGGNTAEKDVMGIFDYRAKCGAVYKCICDCTDNENLQIFNKSILTYRYLKYWKDDDIKRRLSLSDTPYKNRKNAALLEFADRLPVWAQRFDTELPELRLDDYGVPINL